MNRDTDFGYKNIFTLVFILLISFFSLNTFRMVLFSGVENPIFRFFSTYLGSVVICSVAMIVAYIIYKKSVNKFTYFILGYLVFCSCYDLIGVELSYSNFKELVVFNKLNQGIFIALVSYVLWDWLYKENKNLVVNILMVLATVIIIINVMMIFRYLFGYSIVDNHAALNNNRLSLEMITIVATLIALQIVMNSQKRLLSYTLLVLVVVISVFYSSRFVLVGSMLVVASVAYDEFLKNMTLRNIEKRILATAFALAILGLLDSSHGWTRELVSQHFESVSKKGSQFENSIRKVRLNRESEESTALYLWMAEKLNFEVDEKGRARIDLNTLSAMSRAGNVIQSYYSFIDNPLGQGSGESKKRKALSHTNHSVFFRSLEAYGIFFLAFAFILYFRIAPSKNLAVWVPLILVGIFTSNVLWCTLLPFIAQGQKSKLTKNKGF